MAKLAKLSIHLGFTLEGNDLESPSGHTSDADRAARRETNPQAAEC